MKSETKVKLRPSADFRPNPARSIVITGVIGQVTVDLLTPKIMDLLTAAPDQPITVFVDSVGGNTYYADCLTRNLRYSHRDEVNSKRIISVGLNMVASAAADLLISADYAILQPHSVLMCHGVRRSGEGLNVTHEAAADLAKNLAITNEQYALRTARNSISRFIFRVATLRSEFAEYRAQNPRQKLSDADCFIRALDRRISSPLKLILRQARIEQLDMTLNDLVAKQAYNSADQKPESEAAFEALVLKCVVDQVVDDHKDEPTFSFRSQGLQDLQAKLEVVFDSHNESHKRQVHQLIDTWGEWLLDEGDRKTFNTQSKAKRSQWLVARLDGVVQELWFFYVAFCRLLQKDDHYLTAEEAYWLGLIDEVAGRPDLPNFRQLVEFPGKQQ